MLLLFPVWLPVYISVVYFKFLYIIIGITLSDEFHPEDAVPTGGVLAVTCFVLNINELPSRIARNIFRALFVDDLAICFHSRSLDTIERHLQQAVNAIQEWATGNGFRSRPTNAKSCISLHPVLGFNGPRLVTHLCQRRSQQSFSGFGGICTSSFKKHIRVLKTECREALNLIRVVAHFEVRRGQRHYPDVVPDHCPIKAKLWIYCV